VPTSYVVSQLFGDEILQILFMLFDKLDIESAERFRDFAHENLSQINWGVRKYLLTHVEEISVAVCDELKRRKAESQY